MVSKVGIFMYFQTGVTYLAVPFITVVLFGLLWKRTNYEAARFGLIGGIVILAVRGIVDRSPIPYELNNRPRKSSLSRPQRWRWHGYSRHVRRSTGENDRMPAAAGSEAT